jgi:hypothetical protein
MNWGKKLVIGMGSFMIFILSLGAIMIMGNEKDTLIDNDYYEKGQAYDIYYKKKQAASDDGVIPEVIVNQYGITITFCTAVHYRIICRRLSDRNMDKTFEGYTEEDHDVQILNGQLQSGPWLLRIEYSHDNKEYVYETEVRMQ